MTFKKLLILLFVIAGFRVVLGDPSAPYYNPPQKNEKSAATDNAIDLAVDKVLRNFKFKDNFKGEEKTFR